MHAIDTNILVRLISRDDREQVKSAEDDISSGAWVSQIVLVETIWVLQSVYGLNNEKIILTLEMLLKHQKLIFQNVDVIEQALLHYKDKLRLGFSDCLILATAQKAAYSPLSTFDKNFAKLEGVREI